MAHRPFTRISEVAFRAASPDDADLRTAGATSREEPGRFNTHAIAALYLSRDPETALRELQRTVDRKGCRLTDAEPCAIHVVRVRLHCVADLTTAEGMRAWGLTAADLANEDMRRCQAVAAEAVHAGAEAICWPSAAGAGQSLAVFVSSLAPHSDVEVATRIDLAREVLASIERGAPLGSLVDLPVEVSDTRDGDTSRRG